jgi:hypothetical protein
MQIWVHIFRNIYLTFFDNRFDEYLVSLKIIEHFSTINNPEIHLYTHGKHH